MKKAFHSVALVSLLLTTSASEASVNSCIQQAAAHQGVPYTWMLAIAKTESNFNPRAMNTANKNGTRDIGLMQINSSWLPQLKKYGITEQDLLDPCVNAHVGAWILAQKIKLFGFTNEAIGSYNTGPKGSSSAKISYVTKVVKSWQSLANQK